MRFCAAVVPLLLIAQQIGAQPLAVKALMSAYPDWIVGYDGADLLFKDGSKLPYDDGQSNKSATDLLKKPDIEDQFRYSYAKGTLPTRIKAYEDPGRIRNEAFFKKMYGATAAAVRKNLTTIVWCPKLVGQQVQVTKINGVDKALKRVSDELDKFPELKPYLTNIGGTFNWRTIAGTNRLSPHSFGMTVDINTKFSDYWIWSCKCTTETTNLVYKNRIPARIVEAFEKNGFIWGGRWYHYDTMHFEYRPELLM